MNRCRFLISTFLLAIICAVMFSACMPRCYRKTIVSDPVVMDYAEPLGCAAQGAATENSGE